MMSDFWLYFVGTITLAHVNLACFKYIWFR